MRLDPFAIDEQGKLVHTGLQAAIDRAVARIPEGKSGVVLKAKAQGKKGEVVLAYKNGRWSAQLAAAKWRGGWSAEAEVKYVW